MDERQEEQFLKKAFGRAESIDALGSEFNERVLHKISAKSALNATVLRYVKTIVPAMLVILAGGILLFVFNAAEIRSFVADYLPMLKPWHIFLVFLLVYFHFVRSILILAFVYLRKRFTFATPFA